MSSLNVYHPGLTFATLVVQFVMANGGVISGLERRRRGGESGEEGDSTPAPSQSGTSTGSNASSTNSAQTSTSLPSSASASSLSNTSTSTSASSSGSNGPTALPAIAAVRSNMPTPVIVGSVVGAVVLGGLLAFLLTICCRRIRKAKKDPDAPLLVLFSRSSRVQTPQTEMSQTQSSPLVASAIAAGLTSNPFITRYSRSFQSLNSSPASSSPLVPASSLPHHSNSVASSSGQSTSHTTATSDLDILQPPRTSPFMNTHSTLLPIINAAAKAAARASPPTSAQLSPLHRSLTMHQKALDADEKEQEGRMETDQIQEMNENDPPPEYNA
ncbi:hypothetical protein CPB84DRAFT_1775306 [Gymnopilus junonius]|uniref:Uncharacterized protein n=1 Tax=Gymnopilus junonius TaxID=109634 RepID=A0A9P5NT74_GYMJU|nr:hypothetical protein CPB84DRAFT_1775306 [Gymnopilus junonius]